VAVRDRLDDVLQARSLPDDLVAPGRLPAKPLHRLIRHPDFPQKIARVKLGEDLRVDRIRFDLRMSDDAHGLGFAITTCLRCGAITAATVDALSVASSTTILLGELLCESLEKMTPHVDAPQAFELVLVRGGRLGESAVDIQSNDPHACSSVSVRSKRELAGDTTSTDPPSRRIGESRKERPCNELGLSAHCLSAAWPHLRAPGAPDGLTITPSRFRK
jgi:hypothetical protein